MGVAGRRNVCAREVFNVGARVLTANFGKFGRSKSAIWRALWKEALQLGVKEYGECNMRTLCDKPPSNTPLHLMAKAEFKYVHATTYRERSTYEDAPSAKPGAI